MGKGDLKPFIEQKKYVRLFVPGLFYSLMVITHMTAMSLTKVAYMISVKRTSLLIGVAYGYLLFKEEQIRGRFFGALLMFAGFVMVISAK